MAEEFLFLGGDPSVDLVNTTFHRQSPGGADELLTSGERARRWFVQAGLLSEADATQLDEDTLLHGTRRMRAALDAVYRPLARRQPDEASTLRGLNVLNAVLGQGRERLEVTRQGEAFARASTFETLGPNDPNVQVARRAADLLHRLEPHRLKQCENPGCDLIFYDDSRNASRRWCSMEACGNQQKQARHRRHAAQKAAS
ncbi:CGNR zinc finger domain-containing protein [Deinococcus ruber]|uniref:Zinc finger CGNR domain-containing protein n=1 Tax=Deinococcus ruber TaxID=1848197 RepID=A0A918C699_9DEIO|nr:CGNR zinc finger domain-containing protein [Deinococcus ruber]GGR07143.1 hypothetical protein GCM10008957_19720 [Deinococcus ruber]